MTPNSRQPLELYLVISIPFASSLHAKSVLKALIPDNVNFPKGFSMKMSAAGSIVQIEAIARKVPAKTVVNTLDEVLQHLSLAKKVMLD